MASVMGKLGLLGFVSSLVAASSTEKTNPVHISPSFQTKMNDADHISKVSMIKEPKVGISGYLYDFESDTLITTNANGQSLGFTTKLATDIFASFESPAFWLSQSQNDWLVINPHLFGEGSIWFSFTVKLFIIEATIEAKLLGFRFSPLDF